MTKYKFLYSSKTSKGDASSLIARKILFYILLFSSFVTLLVTSFQLYSDYQQQTGLVDQKMVELEHSYHESLANAIWFFNVRQIDSILAGITKFEDIHYVSIKLESGQEYHSGERRKNESLRHYETNIYRTISDQETQVGRLKFESNLEGVVQRLGDKFWLILVSQALKTFFVSIFILFIIHYLVTRHLSSISDFAAGLDISEKNIFLSLNRKGNTQPDELDKIVQAMNKMKRNLIEDASEREKSAYEVKKLLQSIEQSSASISILSAEGSIEYVNPRFELSTGFKKDEVQGIKSDSLSFGESTPETYQNIWRTISSGKKWRGEHHGKRKNGSLFWEIVLVSSITGEDQNITNYIVFKDDITELRKAEESLRRSHKMEAIGHLTGGIAHDFNNIIGIIIGNMELLQLKYPDDSNLQRRVDQALKASNRASELTARLLQFSRKEAKSVSQIVINDSISNIEDLISRSLTASISVRTALCKNLWQAEIDQGDLEDAILNLSLNARDSMPDGGTLTIKTENKKIDDIYLESHPECKAGEFVMLSVSDTGTGMSDKVKEQALHPFFTTKDQGKGTGLGLSMVYAFVQRSKGYLDIFSEIGQGTSVQILLPRVQTASIIPHKPEQNETITLSEKGTILVVDDEAGLCELACINLEHLGYNTLSATDAKQAMAILRSEKKVDLLFSDIIMPGGTDGYQLAAAAKQIIPELKIILTSGFSKIQSEAVGECGLVSPLADNLLQKPYTQKELTAAIRLAMNVTA